MSPEVRRAVTKFLLDHKNTRFVQEGMAAERQLMAAIRLAHFQATVGIWTTASIAK